MNDKTQDQQHHARFANALGHVDPENAAQDQRGHINHHGFVKRLKLVEEKFVPTFLNRGVKVVGLEPRFVARHRRSKVLRPVLGIA